jgi:hypothetical protein
MHGSRTQVEDGLRTELARVMAAMALSTLGEARA